MRNNNHSTNQQFLGSYLSLQIQTWLCIILMHDSLPNLLYHEPIVITQWSIENWYMRSICFTHLLSRMYCCVPAYTLYWHSNPYDLYWWKTNTDTPPPIWIRDPGKARIIGLIANINKKASLSNFGMGSKWKTGWQNAQLLKLEILVNFSSICMKLVTKCSQVWKWQRNGYLCNG